MHGIGKVNVCWRDSFPPFPSHYIPCRPHLPAMFVKDYLEHKPGNSPTHSEHGTSVAALWRSIFYVKLDAMLLMLRIGREMNAEHPQRKKFLVHLSQAVFAQHEGDL